MRRIGVFSDIHGNIAALEAVLTDLGRRGVDEYIFAGDIAGIGPYPLECVRRLMSLDNLTPVRGNHEDYHVNASHESVNFVVGGHAASSDETAHHKWRYETLRADPEADAFVRSLPNVATLEREGFTITVVHYAPLSDKTSYAAFPPKGEETAALLADMFRKGGISGDIIIYGHEHAPALHFTDGRLLIDPGSLGCSRAGAFDRRHGARCGILTLSEVGAVFEPLEVSYDIDAVFEATRKLPDGERLARMFYGV